MVLKMRAQSPGCNAAGFYTTNSCCDLLILLDTLFHTYEGLLLTNLQCRSGRSYSAPQLLKMQVNTRSSREVWHTLALT